MSGSGQTNKIIPVLRGIIIQFYHHIAEISLNHRFYFFFLGISLKKQPQQKNTNEKLFNHIRNISISIILTYSLNFLTRYFTGK